MAASSVAEEMLPLLQASAGFALECQMSYDQATAGPTDLPFMMNITATTIPMARASARQRVKRGRARRIDA
jgi:hypothetical protein